MSHTVSAHAQNEAMIYKSLVPEHIDRKEASTALFDQAKKYLRKLYGAPRCIVCEMRGEDPYDHHPENHIESHHWFEWCKANVNNMEMVEVTLRALSPFIHGLYIISRSRPAWKEELRKGIITIPSLWDLPEWKNHPFQSLDDPRNQYFLCHAHHQQSTKEEIADGYDIIGLHHVPMPEWTQYMGLPKGVYPVAHEDHHENTQHLDRRVYHEED